VREWQQTRVRNEAFDCWKYALAGFRLAKLDPVARARRMEISAKVGAGETVQQPAPRFAPKRGGFVHGWKGMR
jgi:phage terminase large subunit GpA-like protein